MPVTCRQYCRPVLCGLFLGWLLVNPAWGSVTRRITVCSDPPGAMVYIDNRPIGLTPVSANFTYYGTREIRLVKDGYETLKVMQPIQAPWYEFPGLDFFSENLTPGELRDHRTFNFRLAPQAVVPNEILRQRAEELRGRAAASGAVLTTPNGTPYRAPNGRTAPGPPGAQVVPGVTTVAPAPASNGGLVQPGQQVVPSMQPSLVPTTPPLVNSGQGTPVATPQSAPAVYPSTPSTSSQPMQIAPPSSWTVPLH